jgi:outer membrane protein OmpA-like peptidoglycan-associated protein
MDKKSYNKYEQRELCQKYRKLPRNMIDQCVKVEEELELATAQVSTQAKQEPQPVQKQKPLPIVRTYTVLFDHDKSDIRSNEKATLDRAMQEIDKYDPHQVTVTGYTDSSGEEAYNMDLSKEREQAVSRALLTRGIENETLDRKARGESDQAVQTKDGIINQENRRVVIDFRR